MRQDSLLCCPACGSTNLSPNGRDGISRYTQGVNYTAWRCECGKAFTVSSGENESVQEQPKASQLRSRAR
jgi:hypothetical protein